MPVILTLEEIGFPSPVTFFVGENGSGKSTILEAIAVGTNAVTIGSEEAARDDTLAHVRLLAQSLVFARGKLARSGFYFRSEDAFGFTKRVAGMMKEFDDLAEEYDREWTGEKKKERIRFVRGQKSELASKYGANPDAYSHGEAFLHLFRQRCVPNGLYLLDEPETPLSPLRQLALLATLKQMVQAKCQFIVATHSPILMAFPGATILNFQDGRIQPTAYDEVEHVSLTRAFLNNPESFLRQL